MNKFLVTIEFRYSDAPKYGDDCIQHISKIITIGVYDTREDAHIAGNKVLEIFEKRFKLNPYYNQRRRFGNKENLITGLAYIQTPFEFYAKVTELKYDNIDQAITDACDAVKRYREFKNQE